MHNQQNKTKQNTCTNICKQGGFMQQQHYSLFMYEQAQGFGSNQTCKQQILRTTHMSCLDRALLLAHTKWGHRLCISLHWAAAHAFKVGNNTNISGAGIYTVFQINYYTDKISLSNGYYFLNPANLILVLII